MIINSIAQAQTVLKPYVPLATQLTGKDITLERMWPLLDATGNPHQRLRTVHIAGTSGKTSTAYYMAALIKSAGQKVGLAVSPNVGSITERIQINGRPISDQQFCSELGIFMDLVKSASIVPSYFELMTAFTLWVLDRQAVAYVVVETGLGGLHDATNVLQRPDKVCIITDIGFDHTEILGNSLDAIAAQKAGIIHQHNQVFMYQQPKEVMQTIEKRISEQAAKLNLVRPADGNLNLKGYQARNWQLARSVYDFLQINEGLSKLSNQELIMTQQTRIPGRMEVHHIKGKTLILDGAHNTQKMTALINTLKHGYPNAKPAVLIGLKQGKDSGEIIDVLKPIAQRVIATRFEVEQDLKIKSIEAAELVKAFESHGMRAVAVEDRQKALKQLIDGPETVCLVTGSLYLIGQIKADLDGHNTENPT